MTPKTKSHIFFDNENPYFFWEAMTSVLLLNMFGALRSFLLKKGLSFERGHFGFPKKFFFSWKRSYFVQMSRCGCLFMFAIYIRQFLFPFFSVICIWMFVPRFRLKSSTVGFKDVGLTVPRWMARSWTPGVRCSRRVPSTGGPPCVGCVRWFRMRRCHGLEEVFAHVFFDMFISKVLSIRRCSSPSFPSGGVMEYGEGGCVLEQFGSDVLKQLISAGVLKQSVFFFGFIYSKHTTALLMYRRIVYILNTLYKNDICWHIGPSRTRILGIECLSPASFGSDSGNPERVVPFFPFKNLSQQKLAKKLRSCWQISCCGRACP